MDSHLERPLANLSIISKEGAELEVAREGDAEAAAAGQQVTRQQQLPELLVEWPQVRHKAARYRAVSCEAHSDEVTMAPRKQMCMSQSDSHRHLHRHLPQNYGIKSTT